MSTLDKLSIRGVRSFGTAQRDEQLISFSTPITLILGENGCGKTTIIECLKYALIGELPPGSSKGQSFVHDPKIFNTSESMGQVKLQVRNSTGDKVTVCRSMKSSVTMKRGAAAAAGGGGTLKFETLDSTIDVMLNGKRETISKRCLDTNVEMANVMGVPKAIINNVLFCHQEDASWPLDESKKLKERFDEIFGTTEYNKTIDKVLKYRKSYEAKAKEKESELNLLEHLKKEAESKNLDLTTAEGKLAKLDETMAKCEAAMIPIRERLEKIRSIEFEITKLYTNKTEVETKLGKCKEHQASLSSKIRTPHDGTVAQLDRELDAFHAKQIQIQTDLRQFVDDLARANANEKRLLQQLGELDRKRTTLIMQRQQEQELHDERVGHLSDLCKRLNVAAAIPSEELLNTTIGAANIETVLEQTRAAFDREDGALVALEQRHDREEAALQADIDRCREKRSKVESDITSANRQAAQLRQEQSRTQQKIDGVEKTAKQLKVIAAEIAKVDRCHADYSRDLDLDADREKIVATEQAINELQDQQDVLDVDVSVLSANAKLSAELGLKQSALEQREVEVRKLRHKHADHLTQLLPAAEAATVPTSQFKSFVQTVGQSLRRELDVGQKRLARLQQTSTELQMTRKNQRAELQRSERDLTESEERLYEQCQSTAYEDVLARVKTTVDKLQLDHGALKASEVLYAKYMQKMTADPCCPLCHKDMSAGEVTALTTEMQDEIRRLPERIRTTEHDLKAEQRKHETLLELRSVHDRIAQLRKDVPRQRDTLAGTESALAKAASDAEEMQMSLIEPAEQFELAQSMLGDMTLLDEALREVDTLGAQLSSIRARLPERSSELTLESAQSQRNALNQRIRADRHELERMRTSHRESSERLQQLREKRNQLKDQQIQMQEGVQALGEMRQRLSELDQQIAKHRDDAIAHEALLAPLRSEFGRAEEAKTQQRDANRRARAIDAERVADARRVEREVLRCGTELRRLADLQLEREIERVRVTTRERQDDQRRIAADAADVAARIESLKEQIAGQQLFERNLLDNRELRQLQIESTALERELETLSKDLGEHDFKSVSREKDGLVRQSDAITMERSECVGQMGELRAREKSLRSELAQPRYQDAVGTYLRTYYASVVLRKMAKDLGTYRVALEWSLMNFHTEKMERINQLVKGLWHKIYRGNDIDYIQIRTDEMKTQNVDKRRSYDYRVVQIKNDSELDMRGRCSAGQRVLACLIIRIALAETFSAHCGVMTLDEPTTNLDRLNIVSLCQALNTIVEERQAQSNFMLVVITHDEEFITTMGRIDHYWRVSRGVTGKSVIERMSVE